MRKTTTTLLTIFAAIASARNAHSQGFCFSGEKKVFKGVFADFRPTCGPSCAIQDLKISHLLSQTVLPKRVLAKATDTETSLIQNECNRVNDGLLQEFRRLNPHGPVADQEVALPPCVPSGPQPRRAKFDIPSVDSLCIYMEMQASLSALGDQSRYHLQIIGTHQFLGTSATTCAASQDPAAPFGDLTPDLLSVILKSNDRARGAGPIRKARVVLADAGRPVGVDELSFTLSNGTADEDLSDAPGAVVTDPTHAFFQHALAVAWLAQGGPLFDGNREAISKRVGLSFLRVVNPAGKFATYGLYEAPERAAKIAQDMNEPVVLNLSATTIGSERGLALTYQALLQNSNVSVVMAAGNDPQDIGLAEHQLHPQADPPPAATSDGKYVVGSYHPQDGTVSWFSGVGDSVNIFAPGECVLVPEKVGGIPAVSLSGTSFSAPVTSFIVAMLLAENLSLAQARDRIRATSDRLVSGEETINAARALDLGRDFVETLDGTVATRIATRPGGIIHKDDFIPWKSMRAVVKREAGFDVAVRAANGPVRWRGVGTLSLNLKAADGRDINQNNLVRLIPAFFEGGK